MKMSLFVPGSNLQGFLGQKHLYKSSSHWTLLPVKSLTLPHLNASYLSHLYNFIAHIPFSLLCTLIITGKADTMSVLLFMIPPDVSTFLQQKMAAAGTPGAKCKIRKHVTLGEDPCLAPDTNNFQFCLAISSNLGNMSIFAFHSYYI